MSRASEISSGKLCYLERGLRARSTVVADRLVEIYRISGRIVEAVLAAAIPDHGTVWRPPEHHPHGERAIGTREI